MPDAPPGVEQHHIPAMSTVCSVLKQSKIRYTRAFDAHECPIHDNGPLWELQLQQVTDTRRFLPMDEVLLQRKRKLEAKVQRYRLHIWLSFCASQTLWMTWLPPMTCFRGVLWVALTAMYVRTYPLYRCIDDPPHKNISLSCRVGRRAP